MSKTLWLRVGMTVPISDDDWLVLHNYMSAHEEWADKAARKLVWDLYNKCHYEEGDSYMPADCDDNPNGLEFDL